MAGMTARWATDGLNTDKGGVGNSLRCTQREQVYPGPPIHQVVGCRFYRLRKKSAKLSF